MYYFYLKLNKFAYYARAIWTDSAILMQNAQIVNRRRNAQLCVVFSESSVFPKVHVCQGMEGLQGLNKKFSVPPIYRNQETLAISYQRRGSLHEQGTRES